MAWQLLLIPVSSAVSGWLVTRLFFIFIFRPHEPKRVAGLLIQGILPQQQNLLAAKIGKMVALEFFSMDEIEKKITDPKNLEKLMPAIEEHIDDFLRNKLKKEMPFIGMFVGDKTVTSLKKVFITELEILFPQIMKGYVSNLSKELNIEQLVTQKISGISIIKMENIFYKNFSRQLRVIGWLSVFVGLIIGLLTMLIIIFI